MLSSLTLLTNWTLLYNFLSLDRIRHSDIFMRTPNCLTYIRVGECHETHLVFGNLQNLKIFGTTHVLLDENFEGVFHVTTLHLRFLHSLFDFWTPLNVLLLGI